MDAQAPVQVPIQTNKPLLRYDHEVLDSNLKISSLVAQKRPELELLSDKIMVKKVTVFCQRLLLLISEEKRRVTICNLMIKDSN